MPPVNRTIVAATIIIVGTGVYHYFFSGNPGKTTVTRIIVGGFMLGLIASVFDLMGFGIGQVTGYILMLAVGVAGWTVITDIAARNNARLAGNPTTVANQFAGGNPHQLQA